MTYGPFSLAGATAADLKFKLWLNSELSYDKVFWGASVNGTDFWGFSRDGNSGGWVDIVLDLTNVPTLGNLTGLPNVWIALVFSSDNLVNTTEGAYVDNIVLRKCTSATCTGVSGAVPDSDQGQVVEIPTMMILAK
jgi:hypothetical protein